MSYNLFLDDWRNPTDCRNYEGDGSKYDSEDWVVVRNYDEFYKAIKDLGLPKFISFDYDLGPNEQSDGLECAEFLKFYCDDANKPVPKYRVHSAWPGIAGKFYLILK